ncbi:general secretion pathway protein GspK [Rhizobium sp. DKSPLA3]|uniref:General secretion pathway protein GspK n=1 Tax=Rhizobium quercicola TaxID=2901226 RepID=A0A9X1NTQ4_9HYPH|nr:type II secretion system protein GspK [Rhizobium quercicola]MCD7110258.1 general secretion pathway protein GspK [Rhizobium quercicola]
MRPPSRLCGDSGYILISVLAVIALLSGLVAALLLLGRAATDSAHLASRDLRQDTLLQSAAALAGYQLFILKRPLETIDGQQLRLDAGVVTFRVTSDAGKVDLNGSGKALLAAAYQASGSTTMRPEVFAARIIAWREPGNMRPTGRADTDGNSSPGQQARHGPFRTLDDLAFVPGLAADDIARLRPFLTVFNPTGRLSAFFAPETLMAAIAGIGKTTSREIVTRRGKRTAETEQAIANLVLVAASQIDTKPPRTYRVVIECPPDGKGSATGVTTVLSAGAESTSPYQVLAWDDDVARR